MPEDVDVPTEKLHEAIQEELEREGGRLLKLAALTRGEAARARPEGT